MAMHPYWIKLRDSQDRLGLRLGVGVTAYSESDARGLLAELIGTDLEIIGVKVIEDIAELDQAHVVPNMGNFFMRGIWFPLGYVRPRM